MAGSGSNRFLELAAPAIGGLVPYVPGKPVAELERELGIGDSIKLASNENPLGPSPLGLTAAQEALGALARYPDGSGFALRAALAARHGVDPHSITLGNGSNDVLDMIARVFLRLGVESVFSEHAFAVYGISTQAVGATPRIAPARDYGHDLAAMRALVNAQTRVVWIANPNNPTGTWLRADELHGFIDSLPAHVLVVVDEAYSEYVEESAYPDASRWLAEFSNLIVTRTFSKAYGLAALRIGYGLSHPGIADLLNRVRHPFNVNSVALAAAQAALEDVAHIRRCVEVNASGMRQLTSAFDAMGLGYIPSVGNFVTVDVERPGGEVEARLNRQGVITRPIVGYGLPNHLRITVGTAGENARLVSALHQVLAR